MSAEPEPDDTEPLDIRAMLDDDELIESIRADEGAFVAFLAASAPPTDDQIAAYLTEWRRDVERDAIPTFEIQGAALRMNLEEIPGAVDFGDDPEAMGPRLARLAGLLAGLAVVLTRLALVRLAAALIRLLAKRARSW